MTSIDLTPQYERLIDQFSKPSRLVDTSNRVVKVDVLGSLALVDSPNCMIEVDVLCLVPRVDTSDCMFEVHIICSRRNLGVLAGLEELTAHIRTYLETRWQLRGQPPA